MKKVHVKYFAILRDAAAKSEETWQTAATSPGELYSELQATYQKFLPIDSVRVAINNQFRQMSDQLNDQDHVVFIPPVAGG